ncbi:Uncharacterized protein RDABS01_024789 [Bienertia sinuspersici]
MCGRRRTAAKQSQSSKRINRKDSGGLLTSANNIKGGGANNPDKQVSIKAFIEAQSVRIFLAWNPLSFYIQPLDYTAHTIHCAVFPKSGADPLNCTFIYAFNTAVKRQSLWQSLKEYAKKYPGPWLTMGDINCVLNMEERLGSPVRLGEMQEARECFEECDLKDIPYTGFYYAWSNKQEAEGRVYSKLERVMAIDSWLEAYLIRKASFLPEGVSDHCPMVLQVGEQICQGKNPFKYFKMWAQAQEYKERSSIAGTKK